MGAASSRFQSDLEAFGHTMANIGIFVGKTILAGASVLTLSPLAPLSVASWGKTAYEFFSDVSNPDHLKVAGLDTIIDVGKDLISTNAPGAAGVINPAIDGAKAIIDHTIKKKYVDEAPGVVPPSEMMKITDPVIRAVRATSQRPHSLGAAMVMQRGARADAAVINGGGAAVQSARV